MSEEHTLKKIEIDGQSIVVPSGTTVLEAAQQLDIDIPTLCYHEALSPQGGCRVCIVEMSVSKRGRTYNWIDAACVYPVEDGLRIDSNSVKVQRERKLILELLLSRAPESPILNELAEKYGAARKRFETIDKGEANCILCGLCFRVCNEVIQAHAIGAAHRGIHKQVVTPFQIAGSLCIGCMACEHICPTGAIKFALNEKQLHIANWEADLEMKSCSSCGKPVAPVVYIEQLKKQVHFYGDTFEKCPECRRKKSVVSNQ